jgi:hypothetical protein
MRLIFTWLLVCERLQGDFFDTHGSRVLIIWLGVCTDLREECYKVEGSAGK